MSSSPTRPSPWGQLLARLEGEVPADTLEAYRRAGGGVYAALDEVEQRRLAAKIEGLDQWSLPLATQTEMLCSWNAFLLQTLGDQFLDADYRANRATVGFVPPVTADQVLAFYSQVEGWLTRANQAGSNPAYLLDVTVPAELPPWSTVEPCPPAHLEATLEAAHAAQVHTDAAMPTFQEKGLPAERLQSGTRASTSARSPTRGRAPTGSATQQHAARSRRCGRTIQIHAGPWRCRTR